MNHHHDSALYDKHCDDRPHIRDVPGGSEAQCLSCGLTVETALPLDLAIAWNRVVRKEAKKLREEVEAEARAEARAEAFAS